MLRRLSPTERVWLVADGLGAPFHLSLVLRGRGLARPAVEEALARAAEANPGARARLEGVLGWSRWVDSGQAPPLLDRPLPVAGPVDGRRLLQGGPGLEVDFSEEGLAIRVHHALMDGRGLWHFAEELFRALRGEELLGGDESLLDQELAGEGAVGEPFEGDLAATGHHTGESWPIWRGRRVEGRFRNLLGRLAVGVAEHAWSFGGGPVGVQVPVDLRAGRRSTSNLTGLVRLELSPGVEASEARTQLAGRLEAGEAQAWLRSARVASWMPLWLMELGGRSKAEQHIESDRFGGTAVLSNLGRVEPLTAPGFSLERCFWIPPCGPSTAAFIGLLGDPQGVEIVAVVPQGLADQGRLDGLLDSLERALLS